MENKVWTKEEITNNIDTNDKWLYRGILALYDKQTEDEKQESTTRYANKKGFDAVNAKFFSSLSEQLLRNPARGLSERQKAVARRLIKKYCTQLTMIANKKL